MTDFAWVGGNGAYLDPAHWQNTDTGSGRPAGPPGIGDTGTIANGSTANLIGTAAALGAGLIGGNGSGGTLAVNAGGILTVGNSSTGEFLVGLAGVLDVTNGGSVLLHDELQLNGGTVAIDSTSAIEIAVGNTLSTSGGALTIAPAATLSGAGIVNGNIINDGNVQLGQSGEIGSTLTVDGDLTGTGAVNIEPTWVFSAGTVGAGQTIAVGGLPEIGARRTSPSRQASRFRRDRPMLRE